MNDDKRLQQLAMRKMRDRLVRALGNEEVREKVSNDLLFTFLNLGLKDRSITHVAEILGVLAAPKKSLEQVERQLHHRLYMIRVRGESFLQLLDYGLQRRAAVVYSQVKPYFTMGESIIDWGCGDGQVTELVQQNISPDTVGYDIRHYPIPGLKVSIRQFDGRRIRVQDGHFDAGLMTNVVHHEEDNEVILEELARIIRPGGRLVVIETVPTEDTEVEFERTFVNDYIYNRIFHNANVPVPGTYETESGWVKRFDQAGFKLARIQGKNPFPLGYDQPLIRDWHTLLVLERK